MNSEKRSEVKTIPIEGMDCSTCVPVLENEVKKLKGVHDVRASYMTKTLKVTFSPEEIELSDIEAAIEGLGYRIGYKTYPTLGSKIRGLFAGQKASDVKAISDEEFLGKVLHASRPVAVLFSSPTCPVCRVTKNMVEEVSRKLNGKAELYEMNIFSTETWRSYDISTVPTIVFFRNGKVYVKLDSAPRREDIEKALTN